MTTQEKLCELNKQGFYLRDDTPLRKLRPELWNGYVEAYSLYSKSPFTRYAVYSPAPHNKFGYDKAVEMAYEEVVKKHLFVIPKLT